MLRVLMLLRQERGGMMTYAENLRYGLRHRGIEAVIDEASSWIPKETGWMVDRKASRAVKDAVRGFDLVHAFGYRCAWACAEALYIRFPWVYTAYDTPKVTKAPVIDRLNAARLGLCSGRAVLQTLVEAQALNLTVVTPCLGDSPSSDAPMPPDFTVLLAGRNTKDRGWAPALTALQSLMQERQEVRLIAAPFEGEPPELGGLEARFPDRIEVHRGRADVGQLIGQSSLVLVPSTRAGFSMLAAEAMAHSRPVLMRRLEGFTEMIVDGQSGFFFDTDAELGERISQVMDAPMARESVAQAGRIRAEDRFDLEEGVRSVVEAYKRALDIE